MMLAEKKGQNLYLINKYSLNNEEKDEELKQFWGEGQINQDNIISLSSPSIHERVCTLSSRNMIKMWSFNEKERKILFETKLNDKVT